jgi:hypothetical protein
VRLSARRAQLGCAGASGRHQDLHAVDGVDDIFGVQHATRSRRLAAGPAHRCREPLRGMGFKVNVQLVHDEVPDGAEAADGVALVQVASMYFWTNASTSAAGTPTSSQPSTSVMTRPHWKIR